MEEVLNVTVDVDKAEARGWSVTLLEDVASDLKSEGQAPFSVWISLRSAQY